MHSCILTIIVQLFSFPILSFSSVSILFLQESMFLIFLHNPDTSPLSFCAKRSKTPHRSGSRYTHGQRLRIIAGNSLVLFRISSIELSRHWQFAHCQERSALIFVQSSTISRISAAQHGRFYLYSRGDCRSSSNFREQSAGRFFLAFRFSNRAPCFFSVITYQDVWKLSRCYPSRGLTARSKSAISISRSKPK